MSVPLQAVGDDATDQNFRALANAIPGGEVILATKVGFVGNGKTNNDAAFEKISETLENTGKTLYFPSGVYKLTKPFTVKGFKIRGAGIYDLRGITRWGTVLSLSGELESTSSHVCTVRRGGWVSGFVWYYPKEVVTNAEPAITASGFCINLDSEDPPTDSRVFDNFFVNVPYGILNQQGWSKVSYNKICATKVAIRDEQAAAEHSFTENEITLGNWTECYGSALGKYICKNAIAFDLKQTLASFTDNKIFGVKEGYRFSGSTQYTSITGGLVDGVRYCVRFIVGHGPTDAIFQGVTFGAGVAGNVGASRDNNASLESNCVNIGTAAVARANIEFNGCYGSANGDLVLVVNPSTEFPCNVSLNGGRWSSPGNFAPTYKMTVSEVSGTFTESVTSNDGDKITGGTSGATAFLRSMEGTTLYLDVLSGAFSAGEKITGSKSGATAKYGSIANNSTFRIVGYSDKAGGNLSVQGIHSDLTAYLWAMGVQMVQGGTLRVIGNNFYSVRSQTNNCIQVATASRFVEMGNISEIPGAEHKDLEVPGPLAHAEVSGESSFSRP